MNPRLFVIAAIILFALTGIVRAADSVVPGPSFNLSGTIATTNTFQLVQGFTGNRRGCLVQNQSASNTMWVFFGACANATKAKSVVLQPLLGVNCQTPTTILTDSICITGTAADTFLANFQ